MTGRNKQSRINHLAPRNNLLIRLTCVRVVVQNGPDILCVPHIVAKLDEFLDGSWKWTLTEACASNFHHLVERLIARQKAANPSNGFWHRSDYRQWQFEKCLSKTVEVGNLKIVQLLTKHFQDCRILKQHVIIAAAKRGLSDIVKWLLECDCDVQWDACIVRIAILQGQFELAKWLQKRLPTASANEIAGWAQAAAEIGDLAMVKWSCSLLTERDTDQNPHYALEELDLVGVVRIATNCGHLHLLQWMMDEPIRNIFLSELKESPQDKINVSMAAARGHIATLTWLIHHYPQMCDVRYAYLNAAGNGHLDIIRLLLSSPIGNISSSEAVGAAASNGHLDIVKCLVAAGFSTNKAIDCAAEGGYLSVVEWLHENTPHSSITNAMHHAAINGHLDVVKWLHENCREGCYVGTMTTAAIRGHLDVVRWFHENTNASCTIRASIALIAAEAARKGDLDMVKWLHFNRTEGCTTDAMDYAAGNGHLDVVKWLHSNRTEGCTTHAMDSAARNGHLGVVKWLHANRPEGCTTQAMDKAAQNNHLAVLKWLDQNRTEGFTDKAICGAVRMGNLEVLEWLYSRQPELCRITAVNCANDVLAYCSHFGKRLGFAEWAHVHHRHEFELTFEEQLFDDCDVV